MADTYMSLIPGFGSGADQYRKSGQDSDQQSQLFRSLLQQTMQNNGSMTPGGALMQGLNQGLSSYLLMNGMPGATAGASSLPGMDAGAMGSMGTFPAVMT